MLTSTTSQSRMNWINWINWINRIKWVNPLSGMNWAEVGQAYRVFWRHPGQGILHIIAAGRKSQWQSWVNRRRAAQAAHLAQAELQIHLPELLALPESTLGGAYARHLISQGFDPEAFLTDADQDWWLGRRLALSHDVHHVITGFDGTPVGEFGLAAFSLVQSWDVLNVFVLSFLPLSLLDLRQAPRLIQATLRGFWLGYRCRPILAYAFEQNWQTPLVEVRRNLGIEN